MFKVHLLRNAWTAQAIRDQINKLTKKTRHNLHPKTHLSSNAQTHQPSIIDWLCSLNRRIKNHTPEKVHTFQTPHSSVIFVITSILISDEPEIIDVDRLIANRFESFDLKKSPTFFHHPKRANHSIVVYFPGKNYHQPLTCIQLQPHINNGSLEKALQTVCNMFAFGLINPFSERLLSYTLWFVYTTVLGRNTNLFQ